MYVKLLTSVVGGVCGSAGDVIDMPESDALDMAAAGHCELIGDEEQASAVEESAAAVKSVSALGPATNKSRKKSG